MLKEIATFISDLFPPKPTFKPEAIPDLTGKIIIVTGANTGVGKETAKALLGRNAKVYIAARSQERAEQAIEDLKRETGKEGVYLHVDLADLASVKAAADEFLNKEQVLHVLFNNAGVMFPPVADVTAQEYDLQFGTNVLGHYYFTSLLIPALLKGVASSPDGKARVVTTSSAASYLANTINFNTLKDGPVRKEQLSGWLYNQSKLGNILVSNGFAKRYGDQGIVSTCVHPGSLDSDLFRHLAPWQVAMMRFFLHPSSFGALTQLYAGTMKEGAELNGKWLRPWARVGDQWCEDQVASI